MSGDTMTFLTDEELNEIESFWIMSIYAQQSTVKHLKRGRQQRRNDDADD